MKKKKILALVLAASMAGGMLAHIHQVTNRT